MKTVSCGKCGLVLDVDRLAVQEALFEGAPQTSRYCPGCGAMVACQIGGAEVCVPDYDARSEEQKIMAKAASDAVAKLKARAGK